LQISYKKEFEQTKAKNEFKPTDTESYKEMKQVANTCSDVSIFVAFLCQFKVSSELNEYVL